MKFLTFKRKSRKKLPVSTTCRNCGTQLVSRFCHNCGQDLFAGSDRTVGEIFYNAADTIFAWDNKIIKTLKLLLFLPGKLTKEFLSGRIVQYVYPAKLFWFITILFFAVINIADESGYEVDTKDMTEAIAYVDKKETTGTKMEDKKTSVGRDKKTSEKEDDKIETQIRQKLLTYMPYVMFLLVPFFAFLLFIFFHKEKKYYANHMIFALHFHSFVFLLFTIFVLTKNLIPGLWNSMMKIIILFLPAVYFIIALYIVYQPGIPKLIWKVPLIMILYGIASAIILILFTLLVIHVVKVMHNVDMFG